MIQKIILIALLVGASSLLLSAETIYLKNGQTILADSTRENGAHIEYQIGDDTYAISKSLVDHIASVGTPLHPAGHDDVTVVPPSEDIDHSDEVTAKLIKDGHIDPTAIAAVERLGSPELSAAAFFVAGRFEQEHGDREKARQYLRRGLDYQPDNSALLDRFAALLIQLRRAPEAIPFAEHATRLHPDSADAFNVLGHAYYQSDRTNDAIRAWRRSLELRPDSEVTRYLAKAERESKVETDFQQAETGHFTLHYEGHQTSDVLRRQILDTLETHFNELVSELGAEPRNSISVSLYTDEAFFDVTQAPSWSAALNDGKLRIPIHGMTAMTPALSRVLKHELAHSFINEMSRGRCPQWLHEGVAQIVEPANTDRVGSLLSHLYSAHQEMPLNMLEGSWLSFPTGQARLAYYESLAAVEYINSSYGMSDIQRILERIGEGASTESALRTTIHSGYAEMEDEVGNYLKKTYGD